MEYRNTQRRLRSIARRIGGRIALRGEAFRRVVAAFLAVAMLASSMPIGAYAQAPQQGRRISSAHKGTPVRRTAQAAKAPEADTQLPDSIGLSAPATGDVEVVQESFTTDGDRVDITARDTIPVEIDRQAVERQILWADSVNAAADSLGLTPGEAMANDSIAALLAKADKPREDEWVPLEVEFNPDPTKAVWMSALFPGLGQVYNRRYWKLPIIVGGYLGLAYATNWNNSMLRDYKVAYADLLDNDPNTRSYMNMFSPNVKEENLDKGWLRNVLQSRKNYFRRNRDLCIICMVGVYLLAMVDAYVDASLSHFDISPDLSMDVAPAVMRDGRQRYPSVGLVWALNF